MSKNESEKTAGAPLDDGWAAIGALYREAWAHALAEGRRPDQAAETLRAALSEMLRLTEAAEAEAFGAMGVPGSAARGAEYAELSARVTRVLERIGTLQQFLASALAKADTDGDEAAPGTAETLPLHKAKKATKAKQAR